MKRPLFLRHTDRSTVDLLVTFSSSRVFNSATQKKSLKEGGLKEAGNTNPGNKGKAAAQLRAEGMKESQKWKVFWKPLVFFFSARKSRRFCGFRISFWGFRLQRVNRWFCLVLAGTIILLGDPLRGVVSLRGYRLRQVLFPLDVGHGSRFGKRERRLRRAWHFWPFADSKMWS